MRIVALGIPDIKLLTPVRHTDARGMLAEIWSRQRLQAAGIVADFVQENHVLTIAAGTLRGLHFQRPPHAQGKLVQVIRGAIFDVAVDIRHGSPSFGRHVSQTLSAENWQQLWIPPGFAHGYCTLEADTEVIYKVTDYWVPESEGGVRWNDTALSIGWPLDPATILMAPRDQALPTLAETPVSFHYEDHR